MIISQGYNTCFITEPESVTPILLFLYRLPIGARIA